MNAQTEELKESELVATPATRPWYTSATLALVALALLFGGVWLYARVKSPFPFFGTVLNNQPAAILEGTDQNGKPFKFDPTGKTTAVFFGFTRCPNICPFSLAYLYQAYQKMTPEEQKKFQVIMVSVDPKRDPPKRLKEYISYFGNAIGLHIKEPKLGQLAKTYGVGYQYVDVKSAKDYQVNHTTATYLIDSAGIKRVLWDYTQLPEVDRILADVRYVMNHPNTDKKDQK